MKQATPLKTHIKLANGENEKEIIIIIIIRIIRIEKNHCEKIVKVKR
jgi:hypothetical protein